MKKKNEVNIEELTAALNNFIQSNKSKTFTRQEIGEKLAELGFNSQVSGIIVPKLFPYEKMGTSRLYGIPKDPVYKGVVEGCYKIARGYKKFPRKASKKAAVKEVKTPITDNFAEAKEINDAIHLLLSKGYKISRPLGLDTKQLLADHPELAQKYMRYANV
jgi:hypothetical protein